MEDNKQNLNLPTNSSVQQETATSITHDHVYDKSQSLIDIANSTFRELCKTLDTEQTKLLDLEKRRKTLQEDLHRLKTEIEKQKQLYQINMVQGLSENLKTLNNLTANESDPCCEDDYIEALTSRAMGEKNELSTEEKLQNVPDQCSLDQNISKAKSQ